jgi:two-component system, LytTR family, sensor histidine kinase AlgZ
MTKTNQETRFSLPDFRNLGILLRLILAAQGLALVAALLAAASPADSVAIFLGYAAYLQPPLLLTLLLLFLVGPWLARSPPQQGAVVAVLAAGAGSVLWRLILEIQYPDAAAGSLPRTALLAALMTLALLAWHDWRARRLSPALPEARLQALQARIRPHFLFNSLNSVLSLIRSEPARAEAALQNLADLYRVLMADNRDLSPLSREMELARAYLDLEGMRLGERLHVDWRTDNAPADALLPPLLLQPLLENAVYHGIEANPQGGRIGIDIFARGHQLHLVVRNPIGSAVRPGNSMAISNIRERLNLHFDAEARLSTHEAGGEFHVQVVMPLKTVPAAAHAH